MKLFKKLLLSLIVILLLGGTAFYYYITRLPTAAPQFVNVKDLDQNYEVPSFECDPDGDFKYAYKVRVNVESVLNDKQIYRSDLNFQTQLQKANGPIVKGVATDITIDEGEGIQNIDDVYYLSRVEADKYALFSAYNDLGLVKQHPMAMLSQLLKALSVGKEDESYHFSYDPLQRIYRYKHTGAVIQRASYPTTADLSNLSNLFNDYQNQWSATLGEGCIPSAVVSEERQGIAAAGHGGYVKFSIQATRIPSYTDIQDDRHTDLANSGLLWEVQQISDSEIEDEVTSREEMWGIVNDFAETKSARKLIRAAQYAIKNIPVDEISNSLIDSELSDDAKRDLIFGLGISNLDQAESYIIDTIGTLPGNQDQSVDIQKVRLMVALAGNGKASSDSFSYLNEVLDNPSESANVRSNALINLGNVVTQLENNGQADSSLNQALTETISEQLNTSNSAAAILAAGNAKIDSLDGELFNKLSSGSSKERYASGTVLARDTANYDQLTQHLANESSALVVNAIVSNLDNSALDSGQRQQLQTIADNASGDKAKIIQNFLDRAL